MLTWGFSIKAPFHAVLVRYGRPAPLINNDSGSEGWEPARGSGHAASHLLDFAPAKRHFTAKSPTDRNAPMAKAASVKIRLVSEEGTGFFYVTTKNSRTMTEKMSMKKYEPKARTHVLFKEAKIK